MKLVYTALFLAVAAIMLPSSAMAARVTPSAISNNTTEAGATATFTITLDEPIICGGEGECVVTIPLSSSNTAEGTVATSVTFAQSEWNTPKTVTVTGVNDYVDDDNVSYTVVLGAITSNSEYYSGFNAADVSATNTDDDTAGITVGAVQGSVSEDGDDATYTVVLNSQPTSTVTVTPTADAQGTISPSSLQFTTSNWNQAQTITVSAVDDSEVEETQSTSVTMAVSSSDPLYQAYALSAVTASITDNDADLTTLAAGASDVDITFTTDDHFLSVWVDGVLTDTVAVGNRHLLRQPRDSFRIERLKLFPNQSYSTVAFLRVNHYQAKLFVFRLTAEHKLIQKQVQIIRLKRKFNFRLKMSTQNDTVQAFIGSGKQTVVYTWKLQKDGSLIQQ